MARRWVMAGLAVAVGLGLCWLALSRLGAGRSEAERNKRVRAELRDDLFRRGQRAFRTLPMTSITELSSRDDALLLLMRAEVIAPTEDGRLQALREEVATYLDVTYVRRSADRYIEWRRSRQAEWIPMEELTRFWLIGSRHEGEFGEPIEPAQDEEALFRKFWDHAPEDFGGKLWPVALASGPRGLAIACGPFDASAIGNRPSLGGSVPRELWIGDYGGTFGPFWRTLGETSDGLPDRMRKTECAEIGLVFKFKDGSFRPIVLTFLWDPGQRTWVLFRINAYNYPLEESGRVVY